MGLNGKGQPRKPLSCVWCRNYAEGLTKPGGFLTIQNGKLQRIGTDALVSNKVGIFLEWTLCLYDLETWGKSRKLVISSRIQISNYTVVTNMTNVT